MEKGSLSLEKRKFPRVPIQAEVRFRKLASDEEKAEAMSYVVAKSQDLSQGGLALIETAHLKKGDLLKMELEIPGHDAVIKAYSEVMWIRPPKVVDGQQIETAGIKFMGLRPADEQFLVNLVEKAGGAKEPKAAAKRVSENEFIKKMGKRFVKSDNEE